MTKNKVYIPQKAKIGGALKKTKKVAVGSRPAPEYKTVSQLIEEGGLDGDRIRTLIYALHIYGDQMDFILADIEQQLRKVDPTVNVSLRFNIDRIKAHVSEMTNTVSFKTNEDFVEKFGDISDDIKEYMYRIFGLDK